MRLFTLCVAFALSVAAAAADEPKAPMMLPPVNPNLADISAPETPETKLVKFIKLKETQASQTKERAKKLSDEASEIENKSSLIYAEACKKEKRSDPMYLPDDYHSLKTAWNAKMKDAQAAYAEVGRLLSDRREAVKELQTKVGIVRLRELGIK